MGAFLLLGAQAPEVATPATIASIIDHANAGDIIKLSPGDYAPISIRDRRWVPQVQFDATSATLRGVRLDAVSGLVWRGGTFQGGGAEDIGFRVSQSDHLSIDGAVFHRFSNVGIAISLTTDARVTNNRFSESGSDGIDIAMSQRILVDHNSCTEFHPGSGAHADCIQLWSKQGFPSVANITISHNVSIGEVAGFNGYDGPYDHLKIEYNIAHTMYYHGISVFDCRNCIVRHNRVETIFNPQHPEVKAWIQLIRGEGNTNCDNKSGDFPQLPGRQPCSKKQDALQ